MSFVLVPPSSRVVLAMLALSSLLYAFGCIRIFRASELAKSQDLSEQVVTTRMEPGNADYWRQLGNTLLYRENDPQGALAAFRQATDLNPRDADAWIAVALALQTLGRSNEERYAISRALTAEPRRLEIIWQSANLHATLGDREATIDDACLLLTQDPARGAAAMYLVRDLSPGVTTADCKSQGTAH